MPIALTRAVPPSIVDCELTHVVRTQIDPERAAREHAAYEAVLASLGCRVERIAATPELPDSVFVEDAAVVLDEIAITTRPGAVSRRAETASVAEALARYRPLHELTPPAIMDGGDVLRIDRRIYVGMSSRTNEEGARQLARFVQPFGYTVRCIRVRGCLHLKSAVTLIDEGRVLHNPTWIDPSSLDDVKAVAVDPDEPQAANVLSVGAALIVPSAYVKTAAMLSQLGYDIRAVDVSELAKAEAGVTCCSLILA
jgi:dimethylargininase